MPATGAFTERSPLLVEHDDQSRGLANGPSSLGPAGTGSRRRLLGDLLIAEGLITKAQLQDALRAQAELATHVPLGQILVDQQAVTQEQLKHILDKYNKTYRLGDILVETMTITEEQLEVALRHQRETGLRLGDVLLTLHLVTEQQIKQALCTQLRVTFMDLDNVTIDRQLAHLISKRDAARHRIIPIARLDDRITVAMDDPTDAAVVQELEASTGCRIDVVTSTAAAFERAFARAYGEPPETVPAPSEPSSPGAASTGLPPGRAPAPAERSGDPETPSNEHRAALRVLQEVEARHAETLRALAELRAAHEALQQEHKTTAETFRALATRTLAELETAREALRTEREANGQAVRALEERHAQTAAQLTELRAAHAALLSRSEIGRDARDDRLDRHDDGLELGEGVAALEAILRRLRG